jgi:hypothetical protein
MTSLRNQLDVYERISSKGLSDTTLEPLLSSIADPFSAYGPPRNDEQIFSILGQNNLTSVSPAIDGSHTSPADGGESGGVTSNGVMNQLIMSPSTPAKGLSRVTSGTTSPLLTNEESTTSTSNGLGISLTAAATLAQQNKKVTANNAVEGSADLFGTDGEDDGGDEASIFSGTEEEGPITKASHSHSGNHSSGTEGGTAEKLIKEKKKRSRDRAVRANAKSRLKNALSVIDESKGTKGVLEAVDTNVESEATEPEGDQTLIPDDGGKASGWWS